MSYIGYSTFGFAKKKSLSMTGQELIKQDIYNHIFTVKGSRPHLPKFGTRIPLLSFEQLDPTLLTIVQEDLSYVFKYDPRVRLIDISLNPLPANNALVAFVDIEYVELGGRDIMQISFGD
jgi:phage baseplate assembly protein W